MSSSTNMQKQNIVQKLIIHVGPFKTGTTSIQNSVFHHLDQNGHSILEAEMIQDNFTLIDLNVDSVLSLVDHLNAQSNINITTTGTETGQPNNNDNDDYNSLKQMLKEARELK